MAVTLLEAKKNVQDALQLGVIDEFAKSNYLLQTMPFDDVVSPTGGGATLTYAYTRLTTQPTAAFREVNTEYTPHEVTKTRYTADLKVFGGTFQVDRVIAEMGGIVNEVTLQMQQKIKAAQALFNDTVINGDSAVDAKAFDGLEKALAGSSTEFNASGTAVDLSTHAAVKTNTGAFLMMMDEFLSKLNGKPDALLMNGKLKARLIACAREYGLYTNTKDAFGTQVETYNGVPLVDVGAKSGTNDDVIATEGTGGTTSLYAVRFNIADGFHAISMVGQPPVKTWLPDYKTSGAVKTGEVEMVAAVALKASKGAGVFRKIKVA